MSSGHGHEVALSRQNRLVSSGGEPEVVAQLRGALERNDAVASVVLGGSRARGTATALSDWDLYLEGDTQEMMAEIPALVASLEPLAAFWEPLSENAGYMIVMHGPVKIDLFPIGGRREIQPPWVPSAETIGAIDAHFWDWTLWLGGKSLRDERQLVADELAKMQWFLLGPLGVTPAPASLHEAVISYRQARDRASEALGADIDPELGQQVSDALRRHRLITAV